MPVNLTKGSVFRTIIVFSLPYFLSYFLQTLYGMADLFITGQFNQADVITAVANGSQIMHMITVVIVGLSMGTTVLISRATGSGNTKEAAGATGNSALLFLIFSLCSSVILIFACPLIIRIMSVPEESVSQTKTYLMICFAGIPFITAYNIFASIFRGLGDSKSPMLFSGIACTVNIALDYLFIGRFGMQAAGAALATILAQAFSVLISFITWKKNSSSIKLTLKDFHVRREIINPLLKIGVPVACQEGFIQISFLIITIIANRRGLEIAAAVGIVEKIITFLFLIPSSMLSTISAIAAQNMGAGEHLRARKTLYYGTALSVSAGLVFAVVFQFAAVSTVALFTDSEEIARLGGQYFKAYVTDCVFAAVHFSFSGFFCAYGYSTVSFLHNLISIILLRIPGTALASRYFPENLYPMGLAAPAGSTVSAVICITVFILLLKKNKLGKTNAE
ncbi:MAG: MATE family efflux transporter [Treponema sp.]|nr:MATE family efflux transporter [Treponema sp.]